MCLEIPIFLAARPLNGDDSRILSFESLIASPKSPSFGTLNYARVVSFARGSNRSFESQFGGRHVSFSINPILTKRMNCFSWQRLLIAAWKVARRIAETPFTVHVEEKDNNEHTHPQPSSKNRRLHGNCGWKEEKSCMKMWNWIFLTTSSHVHPLCLCLSDET